MNPKGKSRLPGFYKRSPAKRLEEISQRVSKPGFGVDLTIEKADAMIENAVGVFCLPLGIATNFMVNGVELLVPMAVEEPSVIAAASNAARMARAGTGFLAQADPSIMTGQVEILDPSAGARERLENSIDEIAAMADSAQPELVSLGGGMRTMDVRCDVGGPGRLVVHLHVDCLDAMGANMVNTMAEAVSHRLAEIAGGRPGLRILTNLADRRLARASCAIPFTALEREGFPGKDVAVGVSSASDFASSDPYRAATHNKGIFNGIDAFLLACGNDWRAVEAGAHAFAARNGSYSPLATWRIEGSDLVGKVEMPMAVGMVGGASTAHPRAVACLDLVGVECASELAQVAVSVGLASNLAALAALSSEGIQSGHMRLHGKKQRLPADTEGIDSE